MSQPLMNLVLPLVDRELENLSWGESNGSRSLYSRSLDADRWRQEVQEYVLQRVPVCYVRVDAEDTPNLNVIPRSLHQQVRAVILEWMQQVGSRRDSFSSPFPRKSICQLVA
ncbi:MAG: hypothetical protein F6K32_00215 [Desertifilum sp. SIO1I2]|nr:hypothetical protein [Desertifilum sp. SIO1I2]